MSTTIFRVMRAVEYNGKRERELFYTENEAEARDKYILQKKRVIKFAEQHGLKCYDDTSTPGYYMNIFADGNDKSHPYTGAVAQFMRKDYCDENFLNLSERPIF